MTTFRKLSQLLALPVALVMFLTMGPLTAAQAAMVPTDEIIERNATAAERARVQAFLEREDVRSQMESLGVDPQEAAARVAGLSDREVQEIAGKLDELPAGQGAVGAVVGAVVIIFLVLLITDILCLTSFYPFTKCVTARR